MSSDAGRRPAVSGRREGATLWRVLNEEWDRDDVLSRIPHALPATVRERVTDKWSLLRTAGLAPRRRGDEFRSVGPSRTVVLDMYTTPAEAGAAEAIALLTEGAPTRRDGESTEPDSGVLRQAFWLTTTVDGKARHEFHGYAAVPGAIARVLCIHDDPADLSWAQETWRSPRHHS
ncbi:hypothetical protein [Actinoplanes subglobosus]|uniref:Uncharacterized protein n=1 Tax=Actinoplanes subglobosus TaxID=1547892 RepID=A0ABV8JB68_9ACTN